MMRIITTTVTLALLALAAPALAGKFYKWVDAQGTTHYDVKPPPDDVQSQQVRTYNSASSDQADELEKLDKQRAERESKAAAERQNAQTENKQADDDGASAKSRCEEQRKNLDILENKPVVRVTNPDTGKAEAIDQQRRQQLIKQTKAALQYCDDGG